jgi:diaminopimelate decarboxylase
MPAAHDILTKRLALFPTTTRITTHPAGEALAIAGCELAELAAAHQTPLYLFDRATLDASLEEYQQALQRHYPHQAGITYAGKAYLSTTMAQWVQQHNLLLDCTGAGEIATALAGGVRRENVLVHGVNKSQNDLTSAIQNAGTIVVDNLQEIERLAKLYLAGGHHLPDIWLRLRPGLAVETHKFTQTGQADSKFGMDFSQVGEAVERCLRYGLPVTGLHFHQGSNFHDPEPLGTALQETLDFVQEIHSRTGWLPKVLSPGGGWGVAYNEDDFPHPTIEVYVHFIASNLVKACRKRNLPLPVLQLEPGRSLVARAGVAVYRVGTVKYTPKRCWLLLDGGIADNIRPALYGTRYTALPIENPTRPATSPAWLGGPYCESSDVLIEEILLPEILPGELIAIPVSGAYHLSMGSNYNGALKPAVLWLEQGKAHLIQRRQTVDDLLLHDIGLPNELTPTAKV